MAGPNKFTIEDAPKSQFTIGDAGPDISSEASMAANPPAAPKPMAMHSQSPTLAKITNIAANQKAPSIEQMEQSNRDAAKFGADSMIGSQIVGPPLARIAESHVLPALKALPFAGKVVSAIDEAPGLIGKAARGATVGGVTGGTEGLIRGHGLEGSAKDAAEGAGFGAAAGLALPAIHKLSGVEPTPDLNPIKGPSTPIRQSPNFNAEEYNAGRKGVASPDTEETAPASGGAVAAPQADVIKVPEPRQLFPGEKEGYNASTPRKLVLDNALQGRPGAAEMLRNMGKTPLFVNESVHNPRSVTAFSSEGTPIGEPTLHGNPTPFEHRMTLNPIGGGGARPLDATNQFENSFGPEHKEVGDLAEWETGSREGVRPLKRILAP